VNVTTPLPFVVKGPSEIDMGPPVTVTLALETGVLLVVLRRTVTVRFAVASATVTFVVEPAVTEAPWEALCPLFVAVTV
jgi:hypothetical protein